VTDFAAVGRRSARIGKEAERGVLQAMRANGFPGAEPKRVEAADRLDINVCPAVVASVKAGEQARTAPLQRLEIWHDEAEVKRQLVGAELALLVVQRRGYGHQPDRVLRWRAWVLGHASRAAGFMDAAYAADAPAFFPMDRDRDHWETELGRALRYVRWLGYGTPLGDDT
jgi:hypothetical protein